MPKPKVWTVKVGLGPDAEPFDLKDAELVLDDEDRYGCGNRPKLYLKFVKRGSQHPDWSTHCLNIEIEFARDRFPKRESWYVDRPLASGPMDTRSRWTVCHRAELKLDRTDDWELSTEPYRLTPENAARVKVAQQIEGMVREYNLRHVHPDYAIAVRTAVEKLAGVLPDVTYRCPANGNRIPIREIRNERANEKAAEAERQRAAESAA